MLSVLMLARIREILIISTPPICRSFSACLVTFAIRVRFDYAMQPSPDRLAQAFVIASDFLTIHYPLLFWETICSMAKTSENTCTSQMTDGMVPRSLAIMSPIRAHTVSWSSDRTGVFYLWGRSPLFLQ